MLNRTLLSENKEDFEYLFELRRSGRTNMWGAAAYLVAEQGLDEEKAKQVTLEYIKNFAEIAKELGIDP